MRVWRATNEKHDRLFHSLSWAKKAVVGIAGEFTDEFVFEGVRHPPERWEWEHENGVYSYADWVVEPIRVHKRLQKAQSGVNDG